jgi:DNA-binding transcriptional ArsR family regulator
MNEVFKALADPSRREILRLLARGEMSAGDLSDQFDLAKASVSHHLAVLKDAGMIRSRRDGQQIFYSLDTTVLQDVLAHIWDLFGGSRLPSEPPSKTAPKKENTSS